MVANPYNLNRQLGYEEILHLVRQLSDDDKAKLVKDIVIDEDASIEKTREDKLAYLKRNGGENGKANEEY